MDNERQKILIVENQIYQFKEIQGFLESRFKVFPYVPENDEVEKENTFIPFMDAVRIYLNPRFKGRKSNKAKEWIKEQINVFKPDLYIVDQILVGNYYAEGGTDLALNLLAENNKPIIFLSRTDQNKKIKDDLQKLSMKGIKYEWVPKGFSGHSILERGYFNEYVMQKIFFLLQESPKDKLIDKIKILRESYDQFDFLNDKYRQFFEILDKVEKGTINDTIVDDCILNFEFDQSTLSEKKVFVEKLFYFAQGRLFQSFNVIR